MMSCRSAHLSPPLLSSFHRPSFRCGMPGPTGDLPEVYALGRPPERFHPRLPFFEVCFVRAQYFCFPLLPPPPPPPTPLLTDQPQWLTPKAIQAVVFADFFVQPARRRAASIAYSCPPGGLVVEVRKFSGGSFSLHPFLP